MAVVDLANCKQNGLVYMTINKLKALAKETNVHMFGLRA